MADEQTTQTVFIQTQIGDGDIGISPVLLQAVNQTLDSNTTSAAEQGKLYDCLCIKVGKLVPVGWCKVRTHIS